MDDKLRYQGLQQAKTFDEETTEKILNVALRLQEAEGEKSATEIDEARLIQIAEEAGVRPDYVRAAMRIIEEDEAKPVAQERRRPRLLARLRAWYNATAGSAREIVNAGLAGAVGGLGWAVFGNVGIEPLSILSVLMMVVMGIVCAFRTRSAGGGALAGLTLGIAFSAVGPTIQSMTSGCVSEDVVFGSVFGGTLAGTIIGAVGSGSASAVHPLPPPLPHAFQSTSDRQEMLRQLYMLQDRLRQGTRVATFLSIDVVESTTMKALSDPLAVEYCFGAYHRFVEEIARAFGGQVHSTAGDGVTCVFEDPEKAYQAARTLQRNLRQFNMTQNRLNRAFRLRCGIHTGTVVTPTGNLRDVEFAHVIDLASHLQKACPPGGIVLSQTSSAGIYDPVLRLGLSEVSIDGEACTVFRPAPVETDPS